MHVWVATPNLLKITSYILKFLFLKKLLCKEKNQICEGGEKLSVDFKILRKVIWTEEIC